jgi:AcrR family transcriptional regulator
MIVDAAIARVDRHGLEELSARKLAQDLGCEAMSLYHHVGSMEALKDAIVDRLLGLVAPADCPGPMEALSQDAEAYLVIAETHPRAFQLVATRRWKGERGAESAKRAVDRFRTLGFDPQESLARARTLGAYLNGAALALAAWAADQDSRKADAEQVKADLLRGLSILVRSLADAG